MRKNEELRQSEDQAKIKIIPSKQIYKEIHLL
jgi:hypothetical protein